MLTNLLVISLIYGLFIAALKYPWKSKAKQYPAAKKPTKAQILNMKLTYNSPEVCEQLANLDEHEAAISN